MHIASVDHGSSRSEPVTTVITIESPQTVKQESAAALKGKAESTRTDFWRLEIALFLQCRTIGGQGTRIPGKDLSLSQHRRLPPLPPSTAVVASAQQATSAGDGNGNGDAARPSQVNQLRTPSSSGPHPHRSQLMPPLLIEPSPARRRRSLEEHSSNPLFL